MRIFKLFDGYDGLKSGHHLDLELSVLDLAKLHAEFYRPLMEMVQEIHFNAPPGLEIVAAVAVTHTTKDDMWYLGGPRNVGWQMKAGTMVFNNNHMQVWQRDEKARPVLHLSDLFFEQTVELVEQNSIEGIHGLILERMIPRLEQMRTAAQAEVQNMIRRLEKKSEEAWGIEDQLRLVTP